MPLLYLILRRIAPLRESYQILLAVSAVGVALVLLLLVQLPNCSGLIEGDFFVCQESGMVVGFAQLALIASLILTALAVGFARLFRGPR